MNITCPHCGTEYEVEKQDIGRFVTCESCGKGFVTGAKPNNESKSGAKPVNTSRCQSTGIVALWICVAILVLNLSALVVLCFRIETDFREMKESVAKVNKSIDNLNDDFSSSMHSLEKNTGEMGKKTGEIYERMRQLDESRHHDAEQIYDRMGRMKLY